MEVNSLLTKSVIQIVGDVLKQFTAVLPQQREGTRISFKNESAAVRKSDLRKYNFDQMQQQKMMTSLFQRQQIKVQSNSALQSMKSSFNGSELHEGEALDDNRSQQSEKFIAN